MTTEVNTDTGTDQSQSATESVITETTPRVEMREGKLYVDGARVYSRDDTNRIAATARQEAERNLLTTLEVDNIDSVKEVIKQLRSTGTEGNDTLNVSALKDAVKKKEQTVEELNARVSSLQNELVLNRHMSNLLNSMPSAWSSDQRSAVVDLMKARNMLQIEGDTFAIRNGDSYLTEDGERPDYKSAVEIVGKTLGLSFGKQGVAVASADKSSLDGKSKSDALNEESLKSDSKYRSAYALIRSHQPSLTRSQITDSMIRAKMVERSSIGNLSQVGVANTSQTQNKTPIRRK